VGRRGYKNLKVLTLMEDMRYREARGGDKCGEGKGKIFCFLFINEVIFTIKEDEILRLHFVTFVMFAILYASVTIVTTTTCIMAIK
jgi:hypothetical protein